MLTGQGFMGTILEFVTTKLLGKRIDLATDHRRRACRAFVELYFCLDRLEEVTRACLEELHGVRSQQDSWVLANMMALHGGSIDSLSTRFFEIGAELSRAVDLYDPDLGSLINLLYGFKYSFLYFISDSMQMLDGDGERNCEFKYLEPSLKLLNLDLDSYLRAIKEGAGASFTDPDRVEWPQNLLEMSRFESVFREVVLNTADVHAIRQFTDTMEEHSAVLGRAREKMRVFIKANFSLDEVLYASKDLPSRIP